MDAATTPIAPTADEIRWATLAHLASLVNLLGIPSPLGPLVVWLLKRHESAFVAQEAAESLNFALSVWIYGAIFLIAALVSLFSGAWGNLVLFGLLWLALILSSLAFSVVGGVRASEGKPYRYPFNIRLVRP
jgi:uncharacterized Tic20 family protein